MLGGGILTVRDYFPVTAYAAMYAYWHILGLYSHALLQCIILIKRNILVTFVVVQ